MPRNAIVVLAVVGFLGSAGVAQTPADRFWPKETIDRFLPEQLPAPVVPGYFTELARVRNLLFTGRYRQALYATYDLQDASPAEIALVRAEAYRRIGQADLARQTLAPIAETDEAIFLLGRIDLDEGKPDEAIKAFDTLVKKRPGDMVYRYHLGQAYEAAGDLKRAIAHYGFAADGFDSLRQRFEMNGAMDFESAQELTYGALAIDRWAAVTLEYKARPELHDIVLSMFVGAYDVVDREYWPAHVAAARYLLAHGDKKGASDELNAANAMNPNAAEVNQLMGQMAVEARSDAGVDEAVRALRDVDPTSFRADLLETRGKLLRRAFNDALAVAERAVARRPRDFDALACLAAVHAAMGDEAKMNDTLARVDAIAPDDATARLTVADVISTVYYDSAGAIPLLDTAVERAPWWTGPQHALGVALIQAGDETRARAVLDAAYAVDPYNVLTVNYLRVLDLMAKFKDFESERFIFRYAEVEDPIVPLYIAPRMDAMYDDLVKRFGFAPEKKPIVEVFPDAQTFSARTSGMPGLETYGASLGRVMTVVAPRAGETLGPFNWSRVLRHEFTHTINLMQTRGRIPRWLTEGLAVWQEKVPYRFANMPPQLHALATEGKMPTPADMRQVRSEMHYMTGFWIVRYIEETHGWDAVLKLIHAYRDGMEEDAAFKAATGDGVVAFHQKFSDWAKRQVSGWGYDKETNEQAQKLTKQAEQEIREGRYDDAVETWQAVAALQPMNPLPPRRLAGIYLRQNKPADALPYLIATLPLELADNRYAKRIARIYDEAGDPTNAIVYATAALDIDPYDPDAHDLLGGLHEKAGDSAKAKQEEQVAKLLRERRDRAARP